MKFYSQLNTSGREPMTSDIPVSHYRHTHRGAKNIAITGTSQLPPTTPAPTLKHIDKATNIVYTNVSEIEYDAMYQPDHLLWSYCSNKIEVFWKINKCSWFRTGPIRSMLKVEKVRKIIKNNEVIIITSCVCASSLVTIHFFVRFIIRSDSHSFSSFVYPLFIHYFCNYILIPFYNIYPFIPIRKKILKNSKVITIASACVVARDRGLRRECQRRSRDKNSTQRLGQS